MHHCRSRWRGWANRRQWEVWPSDQILAEKKNAWQTRLNAANLEGYTSSEAFSLWEIWWVMDRSRGWFSSFLHGYLRVTSLDHWSSGTAPRVTPTLSANLCSDLEGDMSYLAMRLSDASKDIVLRVCDELKLKKPLPRDKLHCTVLALPTRCVSSNLMLVTISSDRDLRSEGFSPLSDDDFPWYIDNIQDSLRIHRLRNGRSRLTVPSSPPYLLVGQSLHSGSHARGFLNVCKVCVRHSLSNHLRKDNFLSTSLCLMIWQKKKLYLSISSPWIREFAACLLLTLYLS